MATLAAPHWPQIDQWRDSEPQSLTQTLRSAPSTLILQTGGCRLRWPAPDSSVIDAVLQKYPEMLMIHMLKKTPHMSGYANQRLSDRCRTVRGRTVRGRPPRRGSARAVGVAQLPAQRAAARRHFGARAGPRPGAGRARAGRAPRREPGSCAPVVIRILCARAWERGGGCSGPRALRVPGGSCGCGAGGARAPTTDRQTFSAGLD